jgi:hypothetical protein
MSADRVTRLGELSPIGRLFTLGSFLKVTGVTQISGNYFPQYCLNIDKEWVELIFSQTHLITLSADNF